MLQWGLSLWNTFFSVGAANTRDWTEMNLLDSKNPLLIRASRPTGTMRPVCRLNWRAHLLEAKEMPRMFKQTQLHNRLWL